MRVVVSAERLCERLLVWSAQYPDPSATADQNAAYRSREDSFLAKFDGIEALTRAHAQELIEWKFQSMPHRKAWALKGTEAARWSATRETLRQALAARDDYEALNIIAMPGGAYRFGPAMGSAVLAACRPKRFTVADTRALKALRALELLPMGPRSFRMKDWQQYLEECQKLTQSCRMSLRDIDRALWVAGADPLLPDPYAK